MGGKRKKKSKPKIKRSAAGQVQPQASKRAKQLRLGMVVVLLMVLLTLGGFEHRVAETPKSRPASSAVKDEGAQIRPRPPQLRQVALPIEPIDRFEQLHFMGAWEHGAKRVLASALNLVQHSLPHVALDKLEVTPADLRALKRRLGEVTYRTLDPGHSKFQTNLALFDVATQSVYVKQELVFSSFFELAVQLAHELLHAVKDNTAVSGPEKGVWRHMSHVEIRTHGFSVCLADGIAAYLKGQASRYEAEDYRFYLADLGVARIKATQLIVFYQVRLDLLDLDAVLEEFLKRLNPRAQREMIHRINIESLRLRIQALLNSSVEMDTRDVRGVFLSFFGLFTELLQPMDTAYSECSRFYHSGSERASQLAERDREVIAALKAKNSLLQR